MADKDEKDSGQTGTTGAGSGSSIQAPLEAKGSKVGAAKDASFQYVGDVVSAYDIGGKEITLAPGVTRDLPADDKKVQQLVKQGLLVPYKITTEKGR